MKEQLSDLLKTAYKYNRVENLEEAFKEFPIEEEWHKGKIRNVLKEDDEYYNFTYEIGDIVFVKCYKYFNGKAGSNHFFVIIDKNNTAVPLESFGMIISSNLNKLKFKNNKLIEKSNKNNLHKDSIVKTDVIYKIMNEQIVFKLGMVNYEKIEEYRNSFYKSLDKINKL